MFEVLAVQHFLGGSRILHYHANHAVLFRRDRLERLNIYPLVSQCFAELSESSGFVLHVNGEFFGRGHVEPPFPVLRTRARSRCFEVYGQTCEVLIIRPEHQGVQE